jgi:hypothetical protein
MEPTTHEKHESDAEDQAFLDDRDGETTRDAVGKGRGTRRTLGILRFAVEVAMAAGIVYLLAAKPFCTPCREPIRKTPVPDFPTKIYTFQTNPRYTTDEMWFNETKTLLTLHNWIELSANARGYVVIPDMEKYDLPKPHTVAVNRDDMGPGYMMTVFHQLHCLSYIAEHYQQGYGGVNLTGEVAHHSSHCFSYLMQGIMCSADTTLEGETDAGPGEGSEHECKDYEKVLEWANTHGAAPWRGNMPLESTL